MGWRNARSDRDIYAFESFSYSRYMRYLPSQKVAALWDIFAYRVYFLAIEVTKIRAFYPMLILSPLKSILFIEFGIR